MLKPYVRKCLVLLLDAILLHSVSGMRVFAHQDRVVPAIATTIRRSLLLICELGLVRIPDIEAPVIAIVVFESVWFFAVNSVVTNLKLLFGHTQRNTADVFDEDHDERSPYDVPADDEKGTHDLEANLATISCDGASRVGDAEGSAALFGGPET